MSASKAGPLILAIDAGTSAVKAAAYTQAGARISGTSIPLSMRQGDGWQRSIAPADVEDALVAAVRRVANTVPAECVSAVGVAAAAPTPLVVDADGAPHSDVCTFSDARAARMVARLVSEGYGPPFRKRTGNHLAVATASALTAMDLWDTAGRPADARFGHVSSLIVHRLTGRWVIDPTHAAYTGLVDFRRPGDWSTSAINELDVPEELLPDLLPSTVVAAPLTAGAAGRLRLPEGIPVTVGAADTACAAAGVGCVEHGQMFESAGTSGVLTVCRDHNAPISGPMNRPHVVGGRWLSHWAMSSSGASLHWLARMGVGDPTTHGDVSALTELAASAPAGSGGVLFLPYLCGERSPVWDPDARGAWVGLDLGTGPAALARSVLESTGYALRQFLELERDASGLAVPELPSVGGGSVSVTWSQIKADICGLRFLRMTDGDAVCRGVALLAASATGVGDALGVAAARQLPGLAEPIEPTVDPAVRRVYERMYDAYVRLYPALRDVTGSLKEAEI